MADFTAIRRSDMLEWLMNIGSPTVPTTFWVSFHTGDPAGLEATAAGNETTKLARISQDDWNLTAANSGIIENTSAKETAAATGADTLTYFGVWTTEASTGFLFGGQINSVTIATDDTVSWAIGALTATLA